VEGGQSQAEVGRAVENPHRSRDRNGRSLQPM